jgi:hypothetical protein
MDLVPLKKHSLTRAQFEQLADIPLEEEWLANITNLKTRRAYKEDVREFVAFTALQDYMGLRSAARSHIIAWGKDMERRGLAPATIRRKLSALSSLFDYLCERNAVTGNPVDGVKRPMANGERRQHASARRRTGPETIGSSACGHAQGSPGSGHPGYPVVSRYPP